MKSIHPKALCIKLIKAETESEVISLLKGANYWNDKYWRSYGDIDNNFSIIGNQQASPEGALVEKLVNSIDAVLIKECLVRGIHPQSSDAPKNVKSAVRDFFDVRGGSLSNLNYVQRNRLSEQIELVATGAKTKPTLSIIDSGEGQYPEDFDKTFLSLAKSNKVKIGFVQGKFNMGGSGVLQFCGKHNIQLIVSKRHKSISKEDTKWGFTVVRRQEPKQGFKSSMYTYLAPEGKVLTFKADSLNVRPCEYPNPYSANFESGTLIKLFEYNLSTGLQSNIKLDLYFKLNELLPEIALPIKMYERRKGYTGVTMQATVNGLKNRLRDRSFKHMEDGFPTSFTFNDIVGEMYAFKKDKASSYVPTNNIIFTVNGQTHGTISNQLFNRKSVGMGSLRNSVLIILNCDGMSAIDRENLFMNSRDRLRSSHVRSEIERNLEDYISHHKGLKALVQKRREEKMNENIHDQKPFQEAMQELINHSKTLSTLFLGKGQLKNPLQMLEGGDTKEEYHGLKYPTFFELITKTPKEAQLGRKFRVQFKTDVANDYFSREDSPGKLFLYHGDTKLDHGVNLWNGYATLTVSLPKKTRVGHKLSFRTELWDKSRNSPFESTFQVTVIKKVNPKEKETSGKRKLPVDKDKDNKHIGMSIMPNIIEVKKNKWGQYGFTKDDCLEIINNGELGFDFVINMDNQYIINELLNEDDPEIKMKYKYAVSIIGMSLIRSNMENKSREITKLISPVIIPITKLSTLTLTE